MSEENTEGLGRRDLLKRGAMVGGALVWTVPAVQTLAGPALATGSPAQGDCTIVQCVFREGGLPCVPVCYEGQSEACCAAIDATNANPDPVARGIAQLALLAPGGACFGTVPSTC